MISIKIGVPEALSIIFFFAKLGAMVEWPLWLVFSPMLLGFLYGMVSEAIKLSTRGERK